MHLTSIMALAATALTVTACANSTTDPGEEKAGLPRPTLRVVMADSQVADSPTSVAMRAFVAEVTQLSAGSVVVEATSGGTYADNGGDDLVVAALTEGEIQLAMVPTRAWSDAGAATTDVLQAPFEVTSTDHMVAVAEDADLVSSALAGLTDLGAHGLVVLPERLRPLLGFDEPILVPGDLEGATMRVLNPGIGDYLELLGATAVQPSDLEYSEMRADKTVRGAETDWIRAQSVAAGAAITSDLVLYAKFNSIAANQDWWESLTPEQQDVLEQAAAHVQEATTSDVEDVAEAARSFCSAGGTVVHAGKAGVESFVQALESVTSGLDRDQLTQLRSTRPASEAPAPAACGPTAGSLDPANVVADAGELPDGVYRFRITPAFASRWNSAHGAADAILFEGATEPDTLEHLVITWTLRRGRYTFEIDLNDEPPFTVQGAYQVKADQMLLELHPEIGNVVNRLKWQLNPDGSLTMTQVDDLKSDWYYGIDWTRID